MAELELRKVDRWHHRTVVLDDLSMRAPSGRITALFGDAESGRMTALKVIAGIEKAHDGEILIDGADISRMRTGPGDVATVFRSAALMPHKSAYDNIAYPLKLARFDKETIEARVLAVAEHFGLTEVLGLRPKRLTALQRYQIGLARALVRDPAIYLFELPSEEDPEIRNLAIAEMKRLRDEFERTVLFATDVVEEARALADWIVVLHNGHKQQMGSPARIVERPASRRVARLFGAKLRSARIIEADEAGITVRLKDGTELTLPFGSDRVAAGERGTLAIWPEQIRREGGTPIYPPEQCYLFDEKGRLAVSPSGGSSRSAEGAARRAKTR